MAGNSSRRGAVRKPGSKKGATVGSGGRGRRALEGKGPTPKAVDRTYHPAAKRAASAAKRQPGKPGPVKVSPDLVVGRNAVLEALTAGVPAQRLDVAAGLKVDEKLKRSIKLAANQGLPIQEVSRTQLDRLAGSKAHQGIVLKTKPYRYAKVADLLDRATQAGQAPLLVALDGVTDPHNLGAVLRSAAAFGVHGVLIPERRSAGVGPTAWKVSAGAAAHMPVARVPNLVRALTELQDQGLFVVGLDGQASTDIAHLPVADGPLVLVVGSEGHGLARLTRQACDLTAVIAIEPITESLNAAVASGIALYQIRQARQPNFTDQAV